MKRFLWILAVAALTSACDSKTTAASADDSRHDSKEHAAEHAAASYVCPMHPEVTDSKPSRCPKCGMTLEPKK